LKTERLLAILTKELLPAIGQLDRRGLDSLGPRERFAVEPPPDHFSIQEPRRPRELEK
jgi:hypothetical protein